MALGEDWMQNQYKAAKCGSKVNITNTAQGTPGFGNTAVATVADTCAGCGATQLDMSRGLFGKLTNGDFDEGIFEIDWKFEP